MLARIISANQYTQKENKNNSNASYYFLTGYLNPKNNNIVKSNMRMQIFIHIYTHENRTYTSKHTYRSKNIHVQNTHDIFCFVCLMIIQ